jgi:cytochrome P450 PksS
MTASEITQARYDVWNPAHRANPQAMYARMRAEHPIHCERGPQSRRNFWFFTRYDDCVAVLKDQRFGKEVSKRLPREIWEGWVSPDDSPFNAINRHLLDIDPPDHTRLRALVHKAFTPKMMEGLRDRVSQISEHYLDRTLARARDNAGVVDLIAEYALPVPITVIAELLGVPVADQDKFRHWTQVLLFGSDEATSLTAVMEFVAYMHELIDQRGAAPQDDLLSALVAAEEAGDKLDRQELLSMIFLLLVAGHETTVNLIGNGTLALLQHPDQMALLRAQPDLIRTAVEEMLRYNGPVETPTIRWAFEDVVVGGVTIPAGDLVLPSLLAANRDPAVFDDPDRFDIRRDPNKHIAFGMGIHYCIGAPLARIEGAVAVNALLARTQTIELAVDLGELRWAENLLLHGMKELPVRLE